MGIFTAPTRSGRLLHCAAVALAGITVACGGKDTGAQEPSSNSENETETATLVFSAIPDDNKTELAARYQLIADYLSKELEVPVKYHPAASYGASVESFKAGDVHLAWLGGVTGVQAWQAVDGARAIAQGVVDPKYKSYFIANPQSGLTPSEEFPKGLKGKTFTFGSQRSTSGRVMPEFFIRKFSGQSPEEFFGQANRYSGSHDVTATQVADGTVDAGALSYKTYDKMVKQGKLDPEKAVIIWNTPDYPDYNWTAHPKLDEIHGAGFIDRLQTALVAIKDPELLKAMDREEGLIPAKNSDFDPIVETMRELGMLR